MEDRDWERYPSFPHVLLMDHMGSDKSIRQAARVSFDKAEPADFRVFTGPNQEAQAAEYLAETKKKNFGLINYLAKNRHGSPFEHVIFTWYVRAPIFVFREFHRHRIASYNEMSGRYTEMEPVFYIPGPDRPLINAGSSAHPNYVPGTDEQYELLTEEMESVYETAWASYQNMLKSGIAKEVARMVLPLGLYSKMYVTMNARSLTNFLSLRTHDEDATHVSHPQFEIQQVAKLMEQDFKSVLPDTYKAWNDNGREPL